MNKSERRYRQRLVRPMLAFAALVAFAVVLSPMGSAATNTKPFLANFGSTLVPAAADTPTSGLAGDGYVTIKITDEAKSQGLGSANVYAPAGVTITGTSASASNLDPTQQFPAATLELRNLNLTASSTPFTARIYVHAPSCATFNWTIDAHQSNDYNSLPGNTLTLDPNSTLTTFNPTGCHLSWTWTSGGTAFGPHEPAWANVGATITDKNYTAAPPASNIQVAVVDGNGALVDLSGPTVTLNETDTATTSGSLTFPTGGNQAPLSHGIATFGSNLKSSTAVTDVEVTPSAPGITGDASGKFTITNPGTACDPTSPLNCDLQTNDSGGAPLDINGSAGGFTFIGESPFTLPIDTTTGTVIEPGCQNLIPVSGSGFAELDGRTNANGTMTVTIFVDMKKIKAKYGANTGQQFIPICIGVKYLVTDTSGTHPVNCDSTDPSQPAWQGDGISNSGTKSVFTGFPQPALCGSGGYWWNIVSSFQDKLDTNPPTSNPEVTSWTTVPIGNTTYREFVLTLPPGLDLKGGY
jgi:hypothetical protein